MMMSGRGTRRRSVRHPVMPRMLILAVPLALVACSQGGRTGGYGLNVPEGAQTPDMTRATTVPRVSSLVIDAPRGSSAGVGVRARGTMSDAGPWIGRLVETDRMDGRLTYRFVVAPPRTDPPANVARSETVMAATFLTPRQLRGVDTVVVEGTENSLDRRIDE